MTGQTFNYRSVFISACAGMLLFGVTLITLGSMATAIQEKFSLDGIASGTLFSILPFGIVAGSLLFGPFADRYGYKLILSLSCLAIFIGLQGIANAPSLAILKLCVFFFGFGGGAINGATNALVSDISGQSRSANLSLLGVFFAIGALGMPLLLGLLGDNGPANAVIVTCAYVTLACGVAFLFIRFPRPKHGQGLAFGKMPDLIGDKFLLLVSFFLLCQSGFEGIINNWTTLYLTRDGSTRLQEALFALSLYVGGMAMTRLVLSWLLRRTSEWIVMVLSVAFLLAGNLLLTFAPGYSLAVVGLILLGIGLAAGFPVMLGMAGARYAEMSGTAFSVIISIALLGNMAINYVVGLIVENYGISHMTRLPFVLTFLMLILSLVVIKQFRIYNQRK